MRLEREQTRQRLAELTEQAAARLPPSRQPTARQDPAPAPGQIQVPALPRDTAPHSDARGVAQGTGQPRTLAVTCS